jgi:N-acetylglutamate synthase-like GNAT family acetyltransferase
MIHSGWRKGGPAGRQARSFDFAEDLMPQRVIHTGELAPTIKIRNDLKPGDIGYLTYLHGVLYAEAHGWDHTFEAYVAGPLAEFAKSQNDRQRIWVVEKDGKLAGSIAIVEASEKKAQLRWLLLHPDLRGHGIGRILVEEAISFCKDSDYSSVFLWTASTQTAAAKLYESVGFHLTEEHTHELWGSTVTEQRYDLSF